MLYLLIWVTLLVLLFSFYSQYVLDLQPCPLCLMQRLCVFILLGIMSLHLRSIKRARVLSLAHLFIAAAGLFFALRHLWLQSLPEGSAPACMPGLDILVAYFPWQEVARALLWGSGDCAEHNWSMLGLSMPGWSALYFVFMVIMGLFLLVITKVRTD
jgi:disulfide bond formation protein DsbB